MPFTLSEPCEYREEIKKSRFLTLALPLANAAQAQALLERHSDPAATHNCWAWKFASLYRSSDDGEPGGTAGRPILAAIEAQDCDQVLVIVTRWYGGIQLGTGGLARAYGGGAHKCLQAASRIALVERVMLTCACNFAELPLLKLRLVELNGVVEQEAFTANGVELEIALGQADIATLQRQLADLSRGRILLERKGI